MVEPGPLRELRELIWGQVSLSPALSTLSTGSNLLTYESWLTLLSESQVLVHNTRADLQDWEIGTHVVQCDTSSVDTMVILLSSNQELASFFVHIISFLYDHWFSSTAWATGWVWICDYQPHLDTVYINVSCNMLWHYDNTRDDDGHQGMLHTWWKSCYIEHRNITLLHEISKPLEACCTN